MVSTAFGRYDLRKRTLPYFTILTLPAIAAASEIPYHSKALPPSLFSGSAKGDHLTDHPSIHLSISPPHPPPRERKEGAISVYLLKKRPRFEFSNYTTSYTCNATCTASAQKPSQTKPNQGAKLWRSLSLLPLISSPGKGSEGSNPKGKKKS